MPKFKLRGQVINHSRKKLLVIETDSGKAIVHVLGPKRKSPPDVDADGFKRADGETIFLHKHWWKIWSGFHVNVYQFSDNLLLPVSLMRPVADYHFGDYTTDKASNWGVELSYVTGVIRGKNRKIVAYHTDKFGKVSKSEGIKLARKGAFDNVDIVRHKNGSYFLRSKRNKTKDDNLT
ncbi:MAG: DUF3892 domain-containing protein [Deltaproteobacteria bacterium]|nr:DUF3892 domain-containing protein [Deltaproteobacteria bacterium]